jgi:hypothetical protein
MSIWINGEEKYKGMVLRVREHNGYHDSYFYAVVWNPETKETFEVEVWATAYAGGYHHTIDASPELQAEVQAIHNRERAEHEAKQVRAGRKVRVIKGRKVAHGTEGEVFWMGTKKFGGKNQTRVGIKDAQGTVYWTSASNVEVVQG